jgi:hypothetical protein
LDLNQVVISCHYISPPGTIHLTIIFTTNDHANQPILTEARNYDLDGDRALETSPNRITCRLALEVRRSSSRWHVLKNRSLEEGDTSLMERNTAEHTLFRTSNFKTLPKDSVGSMR